MAENDIYDNRHKYEHFKEGIKSYAIPICPNESKGNRKYFCKNQANIKYYEQLFTKLEARDTSFVRRLKLIRVLNIVTFIVDKDIKECERTDIDKIMTFAHSAYKTRGSKKDFIKDMKFIWRQLFPEKDEKGREDETIIPYVVRHLSPKIDKSLEKRKDLLNYDEFEKLVAYFAKDPRMQAYLTLAFESLGRPQEILYTKIKDVEIYDNYAKIWVSEHGKEGCKFLQSIDSFPYVAKWYNLHPYRSNKDSFLFINLREGGEQMTPNNINVQLKRACERLNITKTITPYSLKRAGVSYRRMRGDSDVEIQHAAGWSSTKQLKTYDLSQASETFKIELIKRGLIETDSEKYKFLRPKFKECIFCNKRVGFSEEICPDCKRPLDRNKLKNQMDADSTLALNKFVELPQIQELFKVVYKLQKDIAEIHDAGNKTP